MSAAEFWWWWAGPVSIQLLLLVPIVALLDRVAARRPWFGLQTTIWMVVMLRLLLPPISGGWLPAVPALDVRRPETLSGSSSVSTLLVPAFLVWATGVALFGAMAFARYRRVRKMFGQPEGEVSTDVIAAAERAAEAMRLRQAPRITIRSDVTTPFLLGIVRPLVVIPAVAVQPGDRALLEHALLHEFAHVKRRDALANAFCLALQVLYWFHPMVWFATRRLSALREIGCDREAAAASGDRLAYRHTLLLMARPLVVPARAGLALFGRRSELLTRLDVLERPTARDSAWRRGLSAIFGLALLTVSAFVAPRAEVESLAVRDPGATPAGCLQLRYAVYAKLAEEAAGRGELLSVRGGE